MSAALSARSGKGDISSVWIYMWGMPGWTGPPRPIRSIQRSSTGSASIVRASGSGSPVFRFHSRRGVQVIAASA